MDELQPVSRRGKQSFAGMGATILDSLSTLWIMGLKDEFGRGRDWVKANLTFPLNQVSDSVEESPVLCPPAARRSP